MLKFIQAQPARTHFRDNPSTCLKRSLRPPHLTAALIKSRCNYILRRTLLCFVIPQCSRIKRNSCLKANETAYVGVLNYTRRHQGTTHGFRWFRYLVSHTVWRANHFLKAWPDISTSSIRSKINKRRSAADFPLQLQQRQWRETTKRKKSRESYVRGGSVYVEDADAAYALCKCTSLEAREQCYNWLL